MDKRITKSFNLTTFMYADRKLLYLMIYLVSYFHIEDANIYFMDRHKMFTSSVDCYHRIYLRRGTSLFKTGPASRSWRCWGWRLTRGTVCITPWSTARSSSCPLLSSSSATSGFTPSCQCEYKIQKIMSRCTAFVCATCKIQSDSAFMLSERKFQSLFESFASLENLTFHSSEPL